MIGKFTTTPSKFYHSGEGNYGDATYYKNKEIIGFGSLFLRRKAGTIKRIDTVVHEFGHAVWTGEDDGYSDANAPGNFGSMANRARRYNDSDNRNTLRQSSYVYEYAVRSAQ